MEDEVLTFGRWKGTRAADTPKEYQEWAIRLPQPRHQQLRRFQDWARFMREGQTIIRLGEHRGKKYEDTSEAYRQWAREIREPAHHQLKHYQRWAMKQEWNPEQTPEWNIHQWAYHCATPDEQNHEWSQARRYLESLGRGQESSREGEQSEPPQKRRRGRVALVYKTNKEGEATLH